MNKDNTEKGESLCLSCGLCCMGYFHSRASIYNDNDKSIIIKFDGKFIRNDNKLWFQLPCPVFEEKCTIYNDRPSVCSKHQCDLLKSFLSNTTNIIQAKKIVEQMKMVIDELDDLLDTVMKPEGIKDFELRFSHFFAQHRKVEERLEFKQKHASLLMKFAVFFFLKHKYFYRLEE